MFSKAYITEYKHNLRIAWPVMLGQVGHMITQLADAAMVGQYLGKTPLAAVSLANAVFTLYMVLIIGLATGITTITGQYHGERNHLGLSRSASAGVWSVLLCTLPLVFMAISFDEVLFHLDWPPEVVKLALPYYQTLCYSLIPLSLFLAFKHFIDGLELTKPGMIVSLVANLFNVALNYILINGALGFKAYGLMGASYATFASRCLMVLLIVIAIVSQPKIRRYGDHLVRIKLHLKDTWEIIKLGVPIGLQYFMEGGAFIAGAILVGTLGDAPGAAHHIAISIASFTFMFAGGLGATATIRISNTLGASKFDRLPLVTKSLFIQVIALELLFALPLYFFNEQLPLLFAHQEEVLAIAAELLVMAAFFQIVDGIQLLAAGVLRGASDVRMPTIIALISYWIVCIPVGYFLLRKTEIGAISIWIGYTVGLTLASVLLTWRTVNVLQKMMVTRTPPIEPT